MDNHTLTGEQLILFTHQLRSEEREQSTIEKYMREVRLFQAWLAGQPATAETIAQWKIICGMKAASLRRSTPSSPH